MKTFVKFSVNVGGSQSVFIVKQSDLSSPALLFVKFICLFPIEVKHQREGVSQSVCGDVFSVPAGNIPQLDPICVVRAVLAGHSHHHWLERYDEFLLGLFGGCRGMENVGLF